MHCPLCQSKNSQKELFKTVNAFTSSGKLDKIVQTKNYDGDQKRYCKGDNIIALIQCQNCGYI